MVRVVKAHISYCDGRSLCGLGVRSGYLRLPPGWCTDDTLKVSEIEHACPKCFRVLGKAVNAEGAWREMRLADMRDPIERNLENVQRIVDDLKKLWRWRKDAEALRRSGGYCG